MKTTKLELIVLENIANSEYIDVNNIDELIDYPTWSFVATNSTNKLKGALGSCIKKGYVYGDNLHDEEDNTCSLTKEGVEILKENNFKI